jgi:ABC-type glycerol-3-phosphate transport system substrate-binding protein
MKKIMILVASLGLIMACGGNSEKKAGAQTVEEKAISYVEQLVNADSEEEALKVMMELGLWSEDLSDEDNEKIEKATEKWAKKNPDKAVKLYLLMNEYSDEFNF